MGNQANMGFVDDRSTSLTDKASAVMTKYLQDNPYLKTVAKPRGPLQWVNHLEGGLVNPPVIHVASRIGEEGIPNSGIWKIVVVIAFRYIVGKMSEEVAQKVWGAINYELFNYSSKDLSDRLSAIRATEADFLCFSVELSSGEEQTAQENERQRTIQLELNCAAT